jgi:N-acetylmuramoyl-L-alanine amidase-like protein
VVQPKHSGDGKSNNDGDEMTFSLLWLPQVLRAWGLTVNEVPDWQSAGHGDFGKPLGILAHHTCGPRDGDIRDLHVLINGRSDLPGPLCNLGLARSGTFWAVAAGKAYHAGAGNWQGVTDGNAHFIGIEAENIGTSDKHGNPLEPWPDVQMNAYKRGCAAILTHIKAPPVMVAGHKEYALPKGRKDDPNFSMPEFRNEVAMLMSKTAIPTS